MHLVLNKEVNEGNYGKEKTEFTLMDTLLYSAIRMHVRATKQNPVRQMDVSKISSSLSKKWEHTSFCEQIQARGVW